MDWKTYGKNVAFWCNKRLYSFAKCTKSVIISKFFAFLGGGGEFSSKNICVFQKKAVTLYSITNTKVRKIVLEAKLSYWWNRQLSYAVGRENEATSSVVWRWMMLSSLFLFVCAPAGASTSLMYRSADVEKTDGVEEVVSPSEVSDTVPTEETKKLRTPVFAMKNNLL